MKSNSAVSTGRWLRIALGVVFLAVAAYMAYQQGGQATASRQEKSQEKPQEESSAPPDDSPTSSAARAKTEKQESKPKSSSSSSSKSANQSQRSKSKQEKPTTSPNTASAKPDALIMKGLTLKDQEGAVVYKGDIDLKVTLARIKKGDSFPHRNDGATFGNREKRLPQKPPGYYTEYVVPTPDLRGPGPQRLVIGKSGEVFYTSDHYRTFKRIAVSKELLPSANTAKQD